MYKLFQEPILDKHKKLISKDNCIVSEIFELLILFCVVTLFGISFFMEEYGSMTIIYIIYFICSLSLFIVTKFYVEKHLEYTPIIVLAVMIEAYSYSIFSGIVFNINAPSVTVYALMVAGCSAFFMAFKFSIFIHTIFGIIYCLTAIILKPEYGAQDTVNYVIFFIMSLLLTAIIHKSRIAYLKSIDEAVAQKETALENERLERELRVSAMNLYDESVQRKKLNEALQLAEQANKAKTDFLSRVSHDMRTPLNGILGLTMLLRENLVSEKALEDLQQLEMSGRYLLNLINDTLDVSKIESGKLELHPIVCDGRAIYNNVISLARPNLQSKKINFNVKADNLPFTIMYIDVGRLEQVIMNILGNAIKFTEEGGNIDFTIKNISVENGIITDEITIKDSGSGMSSEFLPHLFEPFSQENSERTSSVEGTGLGMTITKQIVELMDGKINVESELGKGTTFTITIKMTIASEEQVKQWQNEEKRRISDMTLGNKRVLLCEDHPLNANIAMRMLKSKGMLVEHAENGEEGVKMFRNSPVGYYDLILMDIRMPVMDGIDATKAIRSLTRADAKQIPIVAMTANAFDEDVREVIEAGMDAHLSKPVERDKFFETLEKMLNLERKYRKQIILIVDDIDINRAVLSIPLGDEYEVLEAESGREALEILAVHKGIDAVITDIQMPEMDGVELIKKIRENDNYRHIVIIANTQFGDSEQEDKLLSLGADEFIYKPNSPKVVEMRIRNALRKL